MIAMNPRTMATAIALAASACRRDAAAPTRPPSTVAPDASRDAAPSQTQADSGTNAAVVVAPARLMTEGPQPLACVGWSPVTQRAACIEGRWGRTARAASWSLVLRGALESTALDLSPGAQFRASTAVTDDPLPEAKLRAARARVERDGVIPFRETIYRMTHGQWTDVPGVGVLRYERVERVPEGPESEARYADALRWRAREGAPEVTVFSFDAAPTGDSGPVVTVVRVTGGPLIVHRAAELRDGDVSEVEARAWVCDVDAGRCR
jgi:hypothetical protein